jgi:hypothetical protein
LGSLNYMMSQVRLEFLDIPLIKNINLRTFIYGELALYPSMRTVGMPLPVILKDSTRISAGFGFSIPINPMISILLYYNSLNFNTSRKGDHERTGYINLNIGFF